MNGRAQHRTAWCWAVPGDDSIPAPGQAVRPGRCDGRVRGGRKPSRGTLASRDPRMTSGPKTGPWAAQVATSRRPS